MCQIYRIGDLCTWFKGYQVPRDDTSVDKEVPYLHYGDLYKKYDFRLDLPSLMDSIIKIDPSDKVKSEQYLHDGDIVFALTSETVDDLGHCTLISNPDGIPFVSGMETTVIHILKRDLVVPGYLNYYFQSNRFQREMRQYVTGMKVYRVHPDDIMDMKVQLPDLDSQLKIVSILDNYSDNIVLLNRINDNLEEIIVTEFNRMLNQPNLEKVSLGDFLYIKGRIGWKGLKKEEYLPSSNYRIINGESLTESGIDWSKAGYISEERYIESPEIMLEIGDILLSKDGTIGKIGFINSLSLPTSVASGIFVIRNTQQDVLPTHFIYYLLKSSLFREFIAGRTEGSVIPHLYQRDFVEFMFPLPSEESLSEFGRVTLPMFKMCIENLKVIDHLTSMRNYLLPKLMSGKIDVSSLNLPTKYSFGE